MTRSGRTVVSTTAAAAHYVDLARQARSDRLAVHVERRGPAQACSKPSPYHVVAGIYEAPSPWPMHERAIVCLLDVLDIDDESTPS